MVETTKADGLRRAAIELARRAVVHRISRAGIEVVALGDAAISVRPRQRRAAGRLLASDGWRAHPDSPALPAAFGRATFYREGLELTVVWRGSASRLSQLPRWATLGFWSVRRMAFGDIRLWIGPGVFTPYPVTLGVVELALERLGDRPPAIVLDVGTGSGAVALSMARHRRHDRIIALDTSRPAVLWARVNSLTSRSWRVRVRRSDLVSAVPERFRGRVELATVNIPYVEPSGRAEPWDPPGTVFGPGADGLDLVRRLARELRPLLAADGAVVIQAGRGQWPVLTAELEALGYGVHPPRGGGSRGAAIGWAELTEGPV